MSSQNLGIFFEVSQNIGLGHLIRCINFSLLTYNDFDKFFFYYIYSEFSNINEQVIEIAKKNKKASLFALRNKEELFSITKDIEFKIFLIDSFQDNGIFESIIKKSVNKLLIWDHYPYNNHDCNYILDHTLNNTENINRDNINDSVIIHGIDKVILNPNFYNYQNINPKKDLKNIMIMMGGTDINQDTLKILKSILTFKNDKLKKIQIYTVVNDNYQNKNEIIKFCDKYDNFKILNNINNNDIPKILNNIDLLINTAGMSNYEGIYFGIPSLTIFTKDYHYLHLSELLSEKIIIKLEKQNGVYLLEDNVINILDNYKNISEKIFKLIPKKNPIENILKIIL